MEKKNRRVAAGAALLVALAGGGGTALVLSRDSDPATVVLTADEGAAARAEREQQLTLGAGSEGAAALDVSTGAVNGDQMATDAIAIDCGTGGEPWVPTAEELASANADADALAAALDRYALAFTTTTDDLGFRYVEYDYNDVVIQSVTDSFWNDRYPVEPPSQADLDAVKAENDVVAAALDAAGLSYTRTTGEDGWETLQWDWENPDAQAAVDAAYAELYPPQPPTAEEAAAIKADNDKLAAAFDAAGVAYTRMSDELGWEWIEWDYEDAALAEKVNAVFDDLYPVDPAVIGESCLIEEDMIESVTNDEAVASEPSMGAPTTAIDDIEILPADTSSDFTPEQVAKRDAEVAALEAGFDAAGVTNEVVGESPWQSVLFDISNDASIQVVADVVAQRG